MDYKFTFEDGSSAYLTHHGVKGMKWGVWNEETKARRSGMKSATAADAKNMYERGEKWTRAQGRAFKKRENALSNLQSVKKAHEQTNTIKSAKALSRAERKASKTSTKYEEVREWNNPGKSKLSYEQFNAFANKKAYMAGAKWIAGPVAGIRMVPVAAVAGGPYVAAGAAAVALALGGSAAKDLYKVSKMESQRRETINVESGHPSHKTT